MSARHTRGPVAHLLALAMLAACGESTGAGGADVRVETIPAESLEVIGTTEFVTRIADAATAPDGNVWILNTTDPFFVQMSPDGEVIRSWGRRGGGPAEFRNPNALVTDAESGTIMVFDRGHYALMRVDGEDREIETFPIPRDGITPGGLASPDNAGTGGGRIWLRDSPTGFIFAVGRTNSGDNTRLWTANLLRVERDGSTGTAFAMADRLGDPATRFGEEASEFLPYPLWAICSDGTAALYDPLNNRVLRIDANDAVTDTISLPPERAVEITFDRLFRMAFAFMSVEAPGQMPDSAAMYAQLQGQWGTMRQEIATVFPEYADLQCAGDGALWVQLFDHERGILGRGSVWYRINDRGELRAFEMPDSFRPLRFEGMNVLGIRRGELDVESIARLRLPDQ